MQHGQRREKRLRKFLLEELLAEGEKHCASFGHNCSNFYKVCSWKAALPFQLQWHKDLACMENFVAFLCPHDECCHVLRTIKACEIQSSGF